MDFSQLGGTFLSFLEKVPVLRAILGVIIVFFVPGFAWTLALFRNIKIIERIGISIGLSIAIITLSILVLNLIFGVNINGSNTLVTIGVMTVIPLGIYLARRYISSRKPEAADGE
jgi:uncharacterized membrane protein